jgi:hypothetical protein
VYRAYPWSFASANATLSVVDGLATLPSNFDDQHKVFAYYATGDNQYEVKEINFGDQDLYQTGDNKVWLDSASIKKRINHKADKYIRGYLYHLMPSNQNQLYHEKNFLG